MQQLFLKYGIGYLKNDRINIISYYYHSKQLVGPLKQSVADNAADTDDRAISLKLYS